MYLARWKEGKKLQCNFSEACRVSCCGRPKIVPFCAAILWPSLPTLGGIPLARAAMRFRPRTRATRAGLHADGAGFGIA